MTVAAGVRAAPPFFCKSGAGDFFAPAIQCKLAVNQAGDQFEQEADRMADQAMRGPPDAQREKKPAPPLQRKDNGGAPAIDGATESAIGNQMGGGQALAGDVRGFMEPRFNADFGAVRVHSDAQAGALSNRLGARAFTHQNHVFFSHGQYQPGTGTGQRLLAHELTHTIQQGHAIQRSAQISVTPGAPAIQRLGVQDVLDYFADKANIIPGFRLLSILLGFNPINRRSAERSAANILRALVELLPGGALIAQALDNHGVFAKAGAWVEQQLAVLGDIGGAIVGALRTFIDGLGWSDVFSLGSVWERAKAIFTTPIARLIAFGAGVVTGLMAIVRQVVLRPLAALAEGTPAYGLLKAVLGQDPVTGEPVPRTAATLIGGFMTLIGQQEVWQNIQKGNAVGRAWDWFQGALAGLMAFARAIPGQILATLAGITWQDVLSIVGLFAKVGRAFLSVAGEFLSWAGAQVVSLLEIIFSVVAPNAVPYIKKAQGAFRTIIQNPIGFVGNLVRAGKLGFQLFASHIGEHLKTALIKWITGPLGDAGVYIPKAFSLIEIVKLVLSVLGLTWQNIRAKLVKIIPDPVLSVLEKTAGVLVTLVRDGPAAAWQEIKNELSELKDTMIAKVTEMITTEVVKAAVMKLVSMLNPAGAVIQAIIAIYNTITFFIQKINQIAAVVGSFIDSIAAIASGQIDHAGKKVEQVMANTLVVIIGFLAKFAGLGNVPVKLVSIVKSVRSPLDKGVDKIVAWLGGLLKKIGTAAKEGVKRLRNWWAKKVAVSGGGEKHTLTFDGEGKAARLALHSEAPELPSVFLENTAKKNAIAKPDWTGPVATAVTLQGPVQKAQKALALLDDNTSAKDTVTADQEAEGLSKELDAGLGALGTHIGVTLDGWKKVEDPVVAEKDIALTRGSFTVEQKTGIAAQHPDKSELRKNKDGKLINVARDGGKVLARRHVVSSSDMATHYNKALVGKKVSMGKLLIEQRGSIADARTPVAALTLDALREAAKTRYGKFFGYLRNMFIGDSAENSRLQENIDPDHPDLQGAGKLLAHVRHIKRAWAFDEKSLEVSGLDK